MYFALGIITEQKNQLSLFSSLLNDLKIEADILSSQALCLNFNFRISHAPLKINVNSIW